MAKRSSSKVEHQIQKVRTEIFTWDPVKRANFDYEVEKLMEKRKRLGKDHAYVLVYKKMRNT